MKKSAEKNRLRINPRLTKPGRLFVLLSVVALLCACGTEVLYAKLDQQQANEMLALLLRADIDARKFQLDNHWDLHVPRDDIPQAVEILSANGYPHDNYESLGEVFKKEGFVSSPLEERTRFLYGLSQELTKTISEIDGVIVARVHLSIPEKDVLNDKRGPSSASVFIKHHPHSQLKNMMASIKALVVNSVEGLPYDNVTVTLFPAQLNNWQDSGLQESAVAWANTAEGDSAAAAENLNYNMLASKAGIALLTGAVFIFVLWLYRRYRGRGTAD